MQNQPHPFDLYVGKKIRSLRRQSGQSLGAIAEKIGVTYQQLNKYESGVNRISCSRLYEMAAVLGFNVNEVFDGYSLEAPLHAVEHDEIQNDADKLLQLFRQVSDPGLRKKIIKLIEALVSNHSN